MLFSIGWNFPRTQRLVRSSRIKTETIPNYNMTQLSLCAFSTKSKNQYKDIFGYLVRKRNRESGRRREMEKEREIERGMRSREWERGRENEREEERGARERQRERERGARERETERESGTERGNEEGRKTQTNKIEEH